MEKFNEFTIDQFIADEYFREWVIAPTRETDEFWQTWIKLHPHKKNEIEEARQLLLSIDFAKTPESDIETERLLNRIRLTIKERSQHQPSVIPSANSSRRNALYRMAAAVSAIAVVGLSIYFLASRRSQMTSQFTAYGQMKEFILPDNTKVSLNANSSLRYAKTWSDTLPREVWLRGEAFFSVTKSPGKGNSRFIVHTNDLDVEVLGTVFNVNSRDDKTQVVLNEGKVKLTSDQTKEKQITLSPGEMAVLTDGEKSFKTKKVNAEIFSSWADNYLSFEEMTLAEIGELIHDRYGYTVINEAGSKTETETFSATIPGTDLDVLLHVLEQSYGVKITKEHQRKIIRIKENTDQNNNSNNSN